MKAKDARTVLGIALGVVLSAGLLLVVLGTTQKHLGPGKCQTRLITADTDDFYIPTSGDTLLVQLEPGVGGADTGTQVTVYGCTDTAATECALYYWDSDDDGAMDASVLTGSSWPTKLRGLRIETVAGYMFFDVTTYEEDAAITLCGAS